MWKKPGVKGSTKIILDKKDLQGVFQDQQKDIL